MDAGTGGGGRAPAWERSAGWVLAVALGAFGAWLCLHQVLWRDEAQPLLIAREVDDLATFIRLLREEGTPGLWHAMLCVLAAAGVLSPSSTQVLFALVAFGTCVAVVAWPRAPLAFRLLPVISGAGAWYLVNVRQYALTWLLLAVITELRARRQRPVLQGVVLFALCQSSLPGTWLAGAWWLHAWLSPDTTEKERRCAHIGFAFAVPVVLVQLWPVPGLFGRTEAYAFDVSVLPQALAVVGRGVAGDPFTPGLIGVMAFHVLRTAHNRWAIVLPFTAAFVVAVLVAVVGYPLPVHVRFLRFLALGLIRQHMGRAWEWPTVLVRRSVVAGALVLGGWDGWPEIEARLRLPVSRAPEVARLLDEHVADVPVLVRAEQFYTPVLAYRTHDVTTWSLARGAPIRLARWDHASMDHIRNHASENLKMSEVVEQVRRVPAELMALWPMVVLSGMTLAHDVDGGQERVDLGDGRALVLIAELRGAIHESYLVYRVRPTSAPPVPAPSRTPGG